MQQGLAKTSTKEKDYILFLSFVDYYDILW